MGTLKYCTYRVVLYIDKVAETEENAREQVEIDLKNADLEAEDIELYEISDVSKEEMRYDG